MVLTCSIVLKLEQPTSKSPNPGFLTRIYSLKRQCQKLLRTHTDTWQLDRKLTVIDRTASYKNDQSTHAWRIIAYRRQLKDRGTYSDLLFSGRLLGFHGIHCMVDLIVVRRLDAADWHSVIYASLVDGGCEGLLGKLEVSSRDEGHCIIVTGLASILQQLPHLLWSTGTRL